MSRPLYIFDVDGTVALVDHRRHLIPDWRAFFAACSADSPNLPVIRTMEMLRITGADIWFFSGRSAEVRIQTHKWFERHTSFTDRELDQVLTMRDADDFTADDVLKQNWYDDMLLMDQQRLVAVFDDRDRVVNMWRSKGVPCFQVAKGEF